MPKKGGAMKKVLYFVSLCILLPLIIISEAFASQWATVYQVEGGSQPYSIVPTDDGGYVVVGHTGYFGGDVLVFKVDCNGDLMWQKIYGLKDEFGFDATEKAYSICPISNGGYVIGGGSDYRSPLGYPDFLVIRIDNEGNVVWEKSYGGQYGECASCILETSDGCFIVGGFTASYGEGGDDLWILKLDFEGHVIWQNSYGGPGNERIRCIKGTDDGNCIVAGYTTSFGTNDQDCWVLKLDGDGKVLWAKTYGGPGNEVANCIEKTSDGNYLIAGYTTSFGTGNSDIWLIKINPNGEILWEKTYGKKVKRYVEKGNEAANYVEETNGGYIIAGSYESPAVKRYINPNSYYWDSSIDILILKVDGRGDLMWARAYGNSDDEQGRGIAECSDGGFTVVSTTKSFSDISSDSWVFKLDSNGDIKDCSFKYTPSLEVLNSLATTKSTGALSQETSAIVGTPTISEDDIPIEVVNVCYDASETDRDYGLDTPSGQNIYTFSPLERPFISINKMDARPIGCGPACNGGDMINLEVGLATYLSGVDFYLGFATGLVPSEIFLFDSKNQIHWLSREGLIKWKENVLNPINEIVVEDLSVSLFEPGTFFTFYLMAAPNGSNLNNFDLWTTTLVVPELPAPPITPTITWLGLLPGAHDSSAVDISADGKVVVGNASDSSGKPRAVIWVEGTGPMDLGALGGRRSFASRVSRDGTAVIGTAENEYRFMHGFRWTKFSGMIDLGTLGGYRSTPCGISSDGSVIVGWAETSTGKWHAFRWTEAEGMVDLGTLGGEESCANAISADGSVIVGWAETSMGTSHAFRWTEAQGMIDLGTLGGANSGANGISADGSVVVGSAQTNTGTSHAFCWTEGGGMIDLGDLRGHGSFATLVSDNGDVVAGTYHFNALSPLTDKAFRWTKATGIVGLGTFNPSTWGVSYTTAYAISGDGLTIVGTSQDKQDQYRAFIWTTQKGLEDLNLYLGFDGNVLTSARAISPDGRYIVGVGKGHEAFILDMGSR
ncbi:MAG: hypothetical protein DRG83_09330 [Deltaproteobacteria bacterium]|nr:MAG: hypothetical protein DRG83_09330 [Deltaproteobacteria bacterium]